MSRSISSYKLYPQSQVTVHHTTYGLVISPSREKYLSVTGNTEGFEGYPFEAGLLCPLSKENAAQLRQRLTWLNASVLGLQTSMGMGDRIGLATAGHIHALAAVNEESGSRIAPIFAQQSVRENSRTHRTPQEVYDDAMWAVFQEGWMLPWGADADNLKSEAEIVPFVEAGYSYFTIDGAAQLVNVSETISTETLREQFQKLPWSMLDTTPEEMTTRYLDNQFELEVFSLTFTEEEFLRAAVKSGAAVAHVAKMYRSIRQAIKGKPFDFEVSLGGAAEPTSLHEHFLIAAELRRLGVQWVSLAPRFVGNFEKGVDYLGDLPLLEKEFKKNMRLCSVFLGHIKSVYTPGPINSAFIHNWRWQCAAWFT